MDGKQRFLIVRVSVCVYVMVHPGFAKRTPFVLGDPAFAFEMEKETEHFKHFHLIRLGKMKPFPADQIISSLYNLAEHVLTNEPSGLKFRFSGKKLGHFSRVSGKI